MDRTPTMQALAFTAYDAFGEDAQLSEERRPSSLDVVVDKYADAPHPEGMAAEIATGLSRHLESQGCTVEKDAVNDFTQMAVTYLQAVYPSTEAVRDEDERRMLSRLYRGHLVEARAALR